MLKWSGTDLSTDALGGDRRGKSGSGGQPKTTIPMNDTIEIPRPAAPAPAPGLLLHCGGTRATREDLLAVPTPPATGSWFPLPHLDLLAEVEEQLTGCGFEVESSAHALSHGGARYFGVIQVRLPSVQTAGYGWIVGLRNSHDKTCPAGLVAGTRVLVCDNLAFTGEVKLTRKHTRHAVRDLRHLTARAVGRLGDRFGLLDRRIAAYREVDIADAAAHDLVVRAVDCRVIATGQVPHVLREWRTPRFEEFRPRTAWSLFNAFTEILKRANPHTSFSRGEALHGLFDTVASLN